MTGAIGIFDSGYGGLTVLDAIRHELPDYDYVYLGDNARAPYGGRSFDVVYQFTRQAVYNLFSRDCPLVILGCNTASAKALRTIQQCDLPRWDMTRRVLGVIRPTAEEIGKLTRTRHVGVLATEGTIMSGSYEIEIKKLHPDITVVGEACPLWAPLVEAGEMNSDGTRYFVEKHISQILSRDPEIDTLLLGCTHYPLLENTIREVTPPEIRIMSQGHYVARSLRDYLSRYPEIDTRLTRNGTTTYLTTERPDRFGQHALIFLRTEVEAQHVDIDCEIK